jgi:hypothetical protein
MRIGQEIQAVLRQDHTALGSPPMTQFYQPDLSKDINSPFIRECADKLVRRSYWLDMDDRTLVMVMVIGIFYVLANYFDDSLASALLTSA